MIIYWKRFSITIALNLREFADKYLQSACSCDGLFRVSRALLLAMVIIELSLDQFFKDCFEAGIMFIHHRGQVI